MNIRILSTSLFCIALLGSALPAVAAVRPEIAHHLQRVPSLLDRGFSVGAMKQIEAAEAVPNQTAEEKTMVDRVKANLMGKHTMEVYDPLFLTSPIEVVPPPLTQNQSIANGGIQPLK